MRSLSTQLLTTTKNLPSYEVRSPSTQLLTTTKNLPSQTTRIKRISQSITEQIESQHRQNNQYSRGPN